MRLSAQVVFVRMVTYDHHRHIHALKADPQNDQDNGSLQAHLRVILHSNLTELCHAKDLTIEVAPW